MGALYLHEQGRSEIESMLNLCILLQISLLIMDSYYIFTSGIDHRFLVEKTCIVKLVGKKKNLLSVVNSYIS